SQHIIRIYRKVQGDCLATEKLEGLDGDKGNTMSGSESMLTYRKEGTEVSQTLIARNWTLKSVGCLGFGDMHKTRWSRR
ncbi:hypothetical protein M3612_15185, partial [Niallia taxi]|uniref:hypothetical protein n=1 Tax=Niallia taxi TaxID=2499688 RepID=UPI0020420522